MAQKAKSVLDGGYVTKETTDKNGDPKITTIIKYTGPFMARASEIAAIAVTSVVATASVTGAIMIEDASWVQRAVMCAIPALTYYPTKWGLYEIVSRKKAVTHSKNLTSFYRFWRQQNFNANIDAHWVIDEHKKTALETRKRESKRANPDFKEPRFYIHAFHSPVYEEAAVLSYEYDGKRFVFAVCDTRRNARKIQSHLTSISSVMRGYKGMAQGTLSSPDQYWDDGDVTRHVGAQS